jgi:hypothetical protein
LVQATLRRGLWSSLIFPVAVDPDQWQPDESRVFADTRRGILVVLPRDETQRFAARFSVVFTTYSC